MTRAGRFRCALLLATLIAAACSDRFEKRYATYREAVEEGAVSRGWIPAYVPQDATRITEVHNLDTNEQLLRFQASPEALTAMQARLSAVPSRILPPPPRYLSPPGDVWRRDLDSGALPEGLAGFRALLESGAVHCIAVDARRLTAYAWTCGGE